MPLGVERPDGARVAVTLFRRHDGDRPFLAAMGPHLGAIDPG